MKRFFTFAVAFLGSTTAIFAQSSDNIDSLKVHELQQIEVRATRADSSTPVANTILSQDQIQKVNYGQDIPSILSLTPSVVATSETGNGIGSTAMRIRGVDPTRINITANGVPMNNPDSHGMYWYDTPDLISSVGNVQIQRGAGTSTQGTAAFGGAVNFTTSPLNTEFGGEASMSYGSYNTNKQAISLGSGLMGGHWIVDGRLTHISSDGYVDRGSTQLTSYMFQAGYYNGNSMLKFVSFGGKAKTYLTYNGVSKEEMRLYGRRYHTSGQYETSDGRYTLEDGTHVDYYDDHTDNYTQINNQLLFNHTFNSKWSINLTAHYTYGDGVYNQYKDDAKLVEYSMPNSLAFDENGDKVRKDLVRNKFMTNHFYGVIGSTSYTTSRLSLVMGGAWNIYTGPHWGELEWMQDIDASEYNNNIWYENQTDKRDGNIFAKASYNVAKGLNIYGDLQYRHVGYKVWGTNDNFVSTDEGMQPLDIDSKWDFFNPKAGINYTFNKRHTINASFAVAHREPARGDFTDRFTKEFPTAERLMDYELGYDYNGKFVALGVNLYYMNYKDQLVMTGQVNDTDNALNINVPKSYRRGVEASITLRPTRWLSISQNATWSQNQIVNYVDQIKNEQGGYDLTPMGKSTISYSPSWLATTFVNVNLRNFDAQFTTQYVGEQYFTNNENPNMLLDSYCVSNLNLGYTLKSKQAKAIRFGLAIYNIFNTQYCNNGYGYSYQWGGERYDESFYFPQAPINVMGNITVKF